MIDVESISEEDFDTLSNLSLEIAESQLEFLDQSEEFKSTRHLIKNMINQENYDLVLSMDIPHDEWWDDELEELEDETDEHAELLEFSIIATCSAGAHAGEETIVAALLFGVEQNQGHTGVSAKNVKLQWLPERNAL